MKQKKLKQKDYTKMAQSYNKFCELYKNCTLDELKELFKDARASKKDAIITLTTERLEQAMEGEITDGDTK